MNKKIKLRIIEEISNSLLYLNMQGIKTQYPINIYYVQPNLNLFREDIFISIKKNINNYSEITLLSFLQLFIDRKINCPKEIFNLILDKIIEKRKDPTLKESLDLSYK
jgi:adenylate cyclase class IV